MGICDKFHVFYFLLSFLLSCRYTYHTTFYLKIKKLGIRTGVGEPPMHCHWVLEMSCKLEQGQDSEASCSANEAEMTRQPAGLVSTRALCHLQTDSAQQVWIKQLLPAQHCGLWLGGSKRSASPSQQGGRRWPK